MTLRRHHSTGTVASAKTGTMAHEWDVIWWTMVPSAIAARDMGVLEQDVLDHQQDAERGEGSREDPVDGSDPPDRSG